MQEKFVKMNYTNFHSRASLGSTKRLHKIEFIMVLYSLLCE